MPSGGFIGNFIGEPDVGINNQTGTTYTLALADRNNYVRLNNAAAITLTVPLNSSVAFPIGTQILIRQVGAGAATVTATVGVTLNGDPVTNGQWAAGVLIKVATDEWDIIGDMTT